MKPSIPASRVWKPEEMNAAFADAYNSGDIDQVLALYEPNSIHVHSNGSLEIGIHSFRHTLEELLLLQGKMVSTNLYCIPLKISLCFACPFHLAYRGPGRPTSGAARLYLRDREAAA